MESVNDILLIMARKSFFGLVKRVNSLFTRHELFLKLLQKCSVVKWHPAVLITVVFIVYLAKNNSLLR